jgi:hypothetical protein
MELREREKGKGNDTASITSHAHTLIYISVKVEDIRMCIENC